ncbi:hypothetical protein CYLTODRAFT_425511 [Cylindrobasidium torrendii FP15055 ss-10]|uniref:Carbohydrate-binding module family 19 domain-containing protein n=1 Tax=Cylindrobasidium torrendii FP15055 ss-10 TaxID=1314674 RepID=A0A0D7B1S2_9AGAR|nr:hypothetical protein CYLTODRAFT_425511 [Cylindrobasidium torrendii FP15055 ss-10]
MQFNTLVAVACAFFVAGTSAYNPIGKPCNSPGAYGCANDEPSINNGNAFVYVCDGSQFQLSALCRGHETCKTAPPRNAYCT